MGESPQSTLYISVAVAIFAVVSFTFLFPCNRIIPLDRRTVAVVGSVLCYLSRRYLFPSSNMNLLNAIDFDVLILLASIMVVNHLVIHLKETKKVITYLQQLVQLDPERGFWMVSLAAFILSPFLTNDGVCLLFVEPILLAFEATIAQEEDTMNETGGFSSERNSKLHSSDAMYFLLALACSSNIGSALTYTGNPQNMIVGTDSAGVMPPYKFFLYMLVPSVLSWLATQWYILRCWRISKTQYQLVSGAESHFSADLTTQTSTRIPLPRLNIPWCGCDNSDNLLINCYSPRASSSSTASTAAAAAASGLMSPTTPRRRRARQRADVIKRVVRFVVSPFPYMVLILVAAMVVMIFVNIMPISGLICFSSILMVVCVVVGNHWRNQKVWAETEIDANEGRDTSATTGGVEATSMHRRKRSRARSAHTTTELAAAQVSVIHRDVESAEESKDNGLIQESNITSVEMTSSATASTSQSASCPDKADTAPRSSAATGGAAEVKGEPTREEKLDNLNEFFEGLFNSIDYSLLVIFVGTFIVVANMESTGIPKTVWDLIVGKKPFQTVVSIIGISLFVLFTSQLLGNVAVIQLAKPNVQDLGEDYKRIAWAVLSFVATVGGNLTITGSAANIIVVEKAARLDPNMTIDFFQHFGVCFWVTMASCAVGGALVYFIVQFDNMISN